MKTYIFFFHDSELNGCFSNWYPASFTVDGVTYRDTEQYFMASKAKLFGDDARFFQIMAAADPAEIKRLGRLVKNFDAAVWDERRYEIMKAANRAKFAQNPELLASLLATGDAVLAEASPYDTIWGIGLGADKAYAADPAAFPGRNLQGKLLMELREEFREGGI